MNDCFEYYTLKLRTLSPTFVGSGKKISKKEFCFIPKDDTISFINMNQFIEYLVKRDSEDNKNRARKFEKFMLQYESGGETLYTFMNEIRMPLSDRDAVTIYTVNNNGCFDNDHTLCDISCFMRNGSNKAYIPGSSVKGMIRTMLVQYLIKKNGCKPHGAPPNETRIPKILEKEASTAENELINTLSLKVKKNGDANVNDALNSIMKGIFVSDSEYIDDSNFIVCKKYDYPTNGGEIRKLNVVRECLKPGVEIEFKIKIDKRFFKPKNASGSFDQIFNEIMQAFSREYKDFYLSKFTVPSGNKKHFSEPFVILGGGSGFFAKNITYTLNGYKKGLEKTADFMKPKKINRVYVNPKDREIGISPHMLKNTKLGVTEYHIGLCSAAIERNDI